MNQKDKELLLADLCARLPYEVILLALNGRTIYQTDGNTGAELFVEEGWKPYLRPMSSMTEEEKREIYDWLVENDVDWFDFSKLRLDEVLISFDSSWLLVNWLIEHHFDYRGLIERGLAIEVAKENNPYKE